ncbi:MAG TPA: hypothetical protein VG963_30840, partial [Polyangiaceae bacterium]|nr:hypothetical protein [Polyangiaceae bacterium]
MRALRFLFLTLPLLGCHRPVPGSEPPATATAAASAVQLADADSDAAAALALAPGEVIELTVAADGHAGERLATPTGSERFVLILASTNFERDAAASDYLLARSDARRAAPSRRVTSCAVSSERFSTAPLVNDPAPVGPAPREGALRSLRIPTEDGGAAIEARALSVGEHAVIWADTTHPTSLDKNFVEQFRDDFERIILPRAREIFGTEPDLDHDGRIQLVFSRLTRERGVAFFSACDLSPALQGCTSSNHGEYLYLTPPDAIKPPYNTPNAIKEILAHEIAHLLHFSRKVLRQQLTSWEDGVYMSEGIGALAQDVIGYQAGNLYVTRAALDGIDQFSMTDVWSGSEPDTPREGVERGGAYLFVRYLYDRAGGDAAQGLEIDNRGGPAFLRALFDSPLWIRSALPQLTSASLADLAVDFYTTLALSNRDQSPDAA